MRRLALAGALLVLCACGQKGALYLPAPAHSVVPAVSPATSAAPADKDKDSAPKSPGTTTP